ncbi:LOW QUALITY PROTEIN: hypothetical protein M8C21_015128, partial [Ambrosia artemisiifolia]
KLQSIEQGENMNAQMAGYSLSYCHKMECGIAHGDKGRSGVTWSWLSYPFVTIWVSFISKINWDVEIVGGVWIQSTLLEVMTMFFIYVPKANSATQNSIRVAQSPQMSRETTYKMSLKNFTLNCSRQIEARGLPLVPESLAALPPFTSITFNSGESNGENCKPEVAKTGLGSSAAMTTAVVAALLNYVGVVDLPYSSKDQKHENSSDLDLVHMIAQTAHCIAQGKVGSGFDVSSAVYGSHRYEAVSTTPLHEVIGEVLKAKWDHERTKFSLPPLMNL